jgi:hypothetical protein
LLDAAPVQGNDAVRHGYRYDLMMRYTNHHGITAVVQGRKFGAHVIAQDWVKGVSPLLLPLSIILRP